MLTKQNLLPSHRKEYSHNDIVGKPAVPSDIFFKEVKPLANFHYKKSLKILHTHASCKYYNERLPNPPNNIGTITKIDSEMHLILAAIRPLEV